MVTFHMSTTALAPPGIIPEILLDSYRCHIIASVVNVIHDIGCEVVHIPGGCTGLVQPLDASYNKPFKMWIHAAWEEYMVNDLHKNGTIALPSREEVSHCCCHSLPQLRRGLSFLRSLLLASRLLCLNHLVFFLHVVDRLVHRLQLCHILFRLPHAVTSDGHSNRLRVRRVKDCKYCSLALLLLHHCPTPSGITVDTIICITHRCQLNKYTIM